MSQSGNIKAAIKTILDALVTAGTLKEVQEDDFTIPFWDRNIGAFPAAFLTGMSIETSDFETNHENLRTYAYDILILQQAENVQGNVTGIEDLQELVMNAFDNAPTLSGNAVGAMLPTTSKPEFITDGQRSYIAFNIQIKARTLYLTS